MLNLINETGIQPKLRSGVPILQKAQGDVSQLASELSCHFDVTLTVVVQALQHLLF